MRIAHFATMSETKTAKTPTVRSVNLSGRTFDFVENVASRGENAGQPYLSLPHNAIDAAGFVSLAAAVGAGPLLAMAVKAFNKAIASATSEAYVQVKDATGKVTETRFDASVASRNITTAIAESVSAAKDELVEKLAALRAEQDAIYGAVLPDLQRGVTPKPDVINKLTTLKINIGQLEAKLVKKTRKPKEAAPAASPAAPAAPAK